MSRQPHPLPTAPGCTALTSAYRHLLASCYRNPYSRPKSLQEQIDTTTSGGKLVFHLFGALAEFERDLIRERTQAGLTAARVRGRLGGRPKAQTLDTPRKVQIAQNLYNDKSNAITDICRTLRISRATLYRYITKGQRSRADSRGGHRGRIERSAASGRP